MEEQQVQRLTERLRLTRQLAQTLLSQQVPGVIAQTALAHLHDLIPCVRGSVSLYERESQMMTILAVRVSGETHLPQSVRISIGDMPRLISHLAKQLVWIEDLDAVTQPSVLADRLRLEDVQSCMSIPLIVEGALFGSLNLGAHTPGFFHDEYQEVGQEDADLIAIALQQAVLRTDFQTQTAALQETTFELRASNAALLGEIETHKQLGAALLESEERFRDLFESSTDSLITYNLDGQITAINQATEQLMGYERTELVGKNYATCGLASQTDIEQAHERVLKLLKEEVRMSSLFEMEIICKDGQRVPVECWIHPIRDHAGDIIGLQSSHRDIRQRKQTEVALQALSRRLLEVQDNERRALAYQLHEEVAQVLSAIKINLDTLQEELTPVPQKVTESTAFLAHSLQHIRSLSLDLHPAILDDLGLPAALEWYASHQVQRANFTLHLSDKRPTSVAPQLELACFRIAQEALTNIAQHAHAQNVWIELRYQNEALHILIRDDGRGFALGKAQQRAQQGLSLGLLRMQERVRLSSGQLTIQSSPQLGTTVYAILPTQRQQSSVQLPL